MVEVAIIYIRSMQNKKFHEIARHTKEPPFVKLVFIQPFLAMALASTQAYIKRA